ASRSAGPPPTWGRASWSLRPRPGSASALLWRTASSWRRGGYFRVRQVAGRQPQLGQELRSPRLPQTALGEGLAQLGHVERRDERAQLGPREAAAVEDMLLERLVRERADGLHGRGDGVPV